MNSLREVRIRISRVDDNSADIPLPSYATPGSSGMDIHAAVPGDISVKPGRVVLVPTALRVEIPDGYEAQVRPRSGLAVKYGVGILNSHGTIDSDYRGEVKIILANFGTEEFTVRRGDRIAQLVISPVVRAVWEEVDAVRPTGRGGGGFGHTGT